MKFRHIVIEGRLGDEVYVEDPKIGSYTAFFKDFPKMVTQGNTIEEAQDNLWKILYDVMQYFFKKENNFNEIKNLTKN
jgi:hypothetical protein